MRYLLASALSLAILGVAYAADGDVRDLMAKLADKDSTVRRQAAQELAEMGSEAKLAAPALRKALRDGDLFVRRFAAQALGKIGPDAKDAKETVSALALAMGDEKKEVQLAAVVALCEFGRPALDALLSAVKDPTKDPAVRKRAAQGLGRIGKQARGAVPALSEMVSAKMKMQKGKKDLSDDDMRIDAAVALGKVARAEDSGAIEALKAVSEGKQRNKALQKAAQGALKEITGVEPPKPKKK